MNYSKSDNPTQELSFLQWLLSEQNIKIALYSGGFLLVLAGFIFLGTNWTRLPKVVRFGVVATTTASMYVGGFLLWKRPLLRLGSFVLVSIASFFVPITFAALHLYLLQDLGISANAVWLYASLICLPLYAATAFAMRRQLFTFLSIAAFFSGITAVFVLFNMPLRVALLAYALLPIPLLFTAKAAGSSRHASFTRWPLFLSAHLTAPLFFLFSIPLMDTVGGTNIDMALGHPLFALGAMFTVAAFYATDETMFEHRISRWLAPFVLATTAVFTVLEFNFTASQGQFTLMGIGLIYQGIGYQVSRRARNRSAGRPIYIAAYVLALLATVWAATTSLIMLGWMLLLGALMLTLSTLLLQKDRYASAAAVILPIGLTLLIQIIPTRLTVLGLALTAILLGYGALAWLLADERPTLSKVLLICLGLLAPFAVGLGVVSAAWFALVLIVVAVFFGWLSWWRERPLITIFALIITNLAIAKFLFQTLLPPFDFTNSFTYAAVIFALVGLSWFAIGIWFRQQEDLEWATPWLLFAAINWLISYSAVIFLSQLAALVFSIALATIAFYTTWHLAQTAEEETMPWATYLGLSLLFIGHFYLMALLSRSDSGMWMPFTAVFCGLYLFTGWFLSLDEDHRLLYGQPMRWTGVVFMLVPLLGLVSQISLLPWGITLAIIGGIIIIESMLRLQPQLTYVGSGACLIALWVLLGHWRVDAIQPYTLPLGVWLLTIATLEQRRGEKAYVFLASFFGLAIVLIPAFVQSLTSTGYALWLLGLGLLVLGTGLLLRSRMYVRFAFLSLLGNGLVHFSPIFAGWEQFLQIGLVGAILLACGLIALFWREHLIVSGRKWQQAWRGWNH